MNLIENVPKWLQKRPFIKCERCRADIPKYRAIKDAIEFAATDCRVGSLLVWLRCFACGEEQSAAIVVTRKLIRLEAAA